MILIKTHKVRNQIPIYKHFDVLVEHTSISTWISALGGATLLSLNEQAALVSMGVEKPAV